jgi:hypothetical protein
MNNKNLLIGLGVAVFVYYFYNKNQKEKLQSTPYTDAELDKLITDLVNKSSAFASNKGIKVQDPQKGINDLKTLFENAKTNGKDLSRANVDKFFKAYWIMILNQEGDKSQGISTKEDSDLVTSFFKQPQPVVSSPQVADRPCKKWVQSTCITTPCPPTCVG